MASDSNNVLDPNCMCNPQEEDPSHFSLVSVKRREKEVDEKIELEFGGPIGAGMIIVFSHFLILYLWICLQYYEGSPHRPTPASLPLSSPSSLGYFTQAGQHRSGCCAFFVG